MLPDRSNLGHILRERIGSFGALRYRLGIRVSQFQRGAIRLLDVPLGGRFAFGRPLSVDQSPQSVANYTLLYPAENILLGDPAEDSFLTLCQFVKNGRIYRGNIFVCEVQNARFYPGMGLVFNEQWRPITESILDEERLANFKQLFRPKATTRREGVYSSITHLWHFRNWHWMADCLPQIYSLVRYMNGRELTLLMPTNLGDAERDSLKCILPSNFSIDYVHPEEWFDCEHFILPSHVSSRANAFLPPEYYEFIRENTLASLGIAKPSRTFGRYYLSRSSAQHRRVLNEPELVALLDEFGFESILMENYSFREQVELFSHAEAVISPHSAALGSLMYSQHLKLCVLYPEAHPATYFYTLARGLGYRHLYLTGNRGEHDDFNVDLGQLRDVLSEEMHLERDEIRNTA